MTAERASGLRRDGSAERPGGSSPRLEGLSPELMGEHPALRDSPERRLLLVVLTDALHICERGGHRAGEDMRRALEVERWVASEATQSPFAFVRVCEALEIDPAPIRRHVRRLRLSRLSAQRQADSLESVEDHRAGRTR